MVVVVVVMSMCWQHGDGDVVQAIIMMLVVWW
jgi:hypothetical protein